MGVSDDLPACTFRHTTLPKYGQQAVHSGATPTQYLQQRQLLLNGNDIMAPVYVEMDSQAHQSSGVKQVHCGSDSYHNLSAIFS